MKTLIPFKRSPTQIFDSFRQRCNGLNNRVSRLHDYTLTAKSQSMVHVIISQILTEALKQMLDGQYERWNCKIFIHLYMIFSI